MFEEDIQRRLMYLLSKVEFSSNGMMIFSLAGILLMIKNLILLVLFVSSIYFLGIESGYREELFYLIPNEFFTQIFFIFWFLFIWFINYICQPLAIFRDQRSSITGSLLNYIGQTVNLETHVGRIQNTFTGETRSMTEIGNSILFLQKHPTFLKEFSFKKVSLVFQIVSDRWIELLLKVPENSVEVESLLKIKELLKHNI